MDGSWHARRAVTVSTSIQPSAGNVTVPHPRKDFPIGTLKSIERQSGIKFGGR
jgi:hypothetical protein